MSILLTGGSGKLGSAIIDSGKIKGLLSPSHGELDIASKESISKYFKRHDDKIDAIIHCAALARIMSCEKNPDDAIMVNIIGTSQLVQAVLAQEMKSGRKIRFIHISTDGVYESSTGNYSEEGPAIPYSTYGWSKLGAECAVNCLKNHCIIRTRFFDPENIPFDDAPTDSYSSGLQISELVDAIKTLLDSSFVGTLNVGGERLSNFDRFKRYKKELKPTTLKKVQEKAGAPLSKDASMDVSRWKSIIKKKR